MTTCGAAIEMDFMHGTLRDSFFALDTMDRKACSVYPGHLAEVLKETWTDI